MLVRFLLAVGVILDVGAFANGKSQSDYWAEVGLEFETAEKALSPTRCLANERAFIGCIYAVNQGIADQRWEVVTRKRVEHDPTLGKNILQDFGPLVGTKQAARTYKSVEQALTAQREENQRTRESLTELYHSDDRALVDFADLAAWVKSSPTATKNPSWVTARVLNGLLEIEHDPHTQIVPAEQMQDRMKGDASFGGIGAILQRRDDGGAKSVVIERPLEGGPGFRAGLRAKDVITHVDGKAVGDQSLQSVVDQIQGPKGTTVSLTIVRGGMSLTVEIERDLVQIKSVSSKPLDGEVGYLRLADFMKTKKNWLGHPEPVIYDELKSQMTALKKQGTIRGWILDMRGNGGGHLGEAIRVPSLFLKPNSLVVTTRNPQTKNVESYHSPGWPITDRPLVVLIDWGSASASEIVAGALQDHHRAFILGQRSFGKGTVQSIGDHTTLPAFGLPLEVARKLMYKFTVERFYLPSDRTTHVEGVYPDIEVFETPNPGPDDKVHFREQDIYFFGSDSKNAWRQTRPEKVEALDDCLKQQGQANTRFEERSDDAIPPDYAQLVAQDAVECVISKNLWSFQDPTPQWVAPKL